MERYLNADYLGWLVEKPVQFLRSKRVGFISIFDRVMVKYMMEH
jgi:hypothetical protein